MHKNEKTGNIEQINSSDSNYSLDFNLNETAIKISSEVSFLDDTNGFLRRDSQKL